MPNLSRLADLVVIHSGVCFCLNKSTHPSGSQRIPPDETDWAFELIHELGFDEDITTKALEATDFLVQEALMLLLNGNDDARISTVDPNTSVAKRIVKQ